MGESYNSPVADNSTEAGRRANRRVEVIIQTPSVQ
jgi:flagellar motor protein MotB